MKRKDRIRLLKARDNCPDCKAAAKRAVETSDFRDLAAVCPKHQG